MKFVLKLLLSLLMISLSLYCIRLFGGGLWSSMLLIVSAFTLASMFVKVFDVLAILIARLTAFIALLCAILGTLAGFIGGSYHLSESSQMILMGLYGIAVLGGCFFFFSVDSAEPTPSADQQED
ncbi:hypothetical protein [Hahella ganghwensis]|uniref:hypothetical protein n=1 Tax=Hahella ganghwensis TaxID=286420 RepID=UPI0003657CD2|nr:hypothetical protein [Hahella ganghwensis]